MGTAFMQKRNIGLVLLIVLLGVSFSLSYAYINRASQVELNQTKLQLTQEKQLVAATEKSLNKQQAALQSTLNLQRELPGMPLIDQYLLDLEKAELLSDSLLLNIGISDGDASLLMQALSSAANATSEQVASGQAADSGANTEDQTQGQEQPPAQASSAPAVKQLTFALSVTSPKYEAMLEFISRLEKLERISHIDSISFSGKAETTGVDFANAAVDPSVEPSSNEMNFAVTVSTFYLSGIDELQDDLPWVEYPQPAGKNNPLYDGRMRENLNKTACALW
jgi:type IV pilus assembly protein PilO